MLLNDVSAVILCMVPLSIFLHKIINLCDNVFSSGVLVLACKQPISSVSYLDMLPSKEEKSKTPPMFLCIKVGKPMRKSFASQSTTMSQQYSKKIKQPEYWFAVPRER